jgi:magnesium transporter
VIVGLEETNEAVIGHNLNDILRVLTSISVVILPLTLIASVMGMNSWVPFEHNEVGFFVVLGVMAAILIGMVAFFKSRRWL